MRLVFACFVLMFLSCVTTSASSAPEGTSTVTEEPAPVAPPKVQARTSAVFTSAGAAIAPRPSEPVEPQAVVDPVTAALRKRGLLTTSASAPSRQDLQAALRAFQKSQGLAETGFADQLTLKKLQQ